MCRGVVELRLYKDGLKSKWDSEPIAVPVSEVEYVQSIVFWLSSSYPMRGAVLHLKSGRSLKILFDYNEVMSRLRKAGWPDDVPKECVEE